MAQANSVRSREAWRTSIDWSDNTPDEYRPVSRRRRGPRIRLGFVLSGGVIAISYIIGIGGAGLESIPSDSDIRAVLVPSTDKTVAPYDNCSPTSPDLAQWQRIQTLEKLGISTTTVPCTPAQLAAIAASGKDLSPLTPRM